MSTKWHSLINEHYQGDCHYGPQTQGDYHYGSDTNNEVEIVPPAEPIMEEVGNANTRSQRTVTKNRKYYNDDFVN